MLDTTELHYNSKTAKWFHPCENGNHVYPVGVHCGYEKFTVYTPDGWQRARIEISRDAYAGWTDVLGQARVLELIGTDMRQIRLEARRVQGNAR